MQGFIILKNNVLKSFGGILIFFAECVVNRDVELDGGST